MGERAPLQDRALVPFAWAVLGFMVIVILQGAVVRITGSGAGCGSHWPLCNGDFFPHHPRLATIIEYLHRSITGVLTTLVAVLVTWVFWKRPKGHRARSAAIWVVVLLVTEALLGAALVLGGYVETNASNMRVFMQCIHFTNTMLLLAALTLTAWRLREPSGVTHEPSAAGPRGLALTSILLTLAVGATGSVAALADTLFPSPSLMAGLTDDFAATAPLIVRMRWIHPAATLLELIVVIMLCLRWRSRIATLVASLLGVQLVFGVVDVLLLAPAWMQVVHLLGADAFWIGLVILASEVRSQRGLHAV